MYWRQIRMLPSDVHVQALSVVNRTADAIVSLRWEVGFIFVSLTVNVFLELSVSV